MRATTIDLSRVKLNRQLHVMRRLLPYLWPRDRRDLRVRVVVALALMLAAKLTNVYVPILLKHATDALSADAVNLWAAVPLGLLLAYGGARAGARVFGEARDAVFARVAQEAVRRLGVTVFDHLHRLSLRFHLDRRTGGLSRAIERGTKGVEFLLTFVLFNAVPTVIEVALVSGILWWMFDWRFAAVTLVTIGAFVALTFRMTEWRIRFRRAMNTADGEAHSYAVDSLLNMETVKAFTNEARETARYDRGMAAYADAAARSRMSLSALNAAQSAVLAVGITVIMTLAAFGVARGAMTVGDFVMVNAYLIQLAVPLNMLGTVYREIKQSLVDMEELFDLLDTPLEVVDTPDASVLRVREGRVAFDRVSFAYDERRPVLRDVSLSVPPGGRVAVVGATGSGKSTLARLLLRFYDVDAGAVTVDGHDVRAVTQESLRAAIGLVPQDTVLFNASIYDNIAYGRPDAPPEAVHAAARTARIDAFARGLPDGYDTLVGERGLKLSGGEKQRVAIARAVLKDPPIMVFDEATSALDTQTEQAIQADLAAAARGRTTLMIAHRLSTVADADEIVVLDAGEVAERGTHAELLRRGGIYARMWRRQHTEADRPAPAAE